MPKNNKSIEKEREKIEQLRARLKDVLEPDYEDFYLRKWLKARNFDLNKAENMFRNVDIGGNIAQSAAWRAHDLEVVESKYWSEPESQEIMSRAYKQKMKVETLLAEYDTPEVIKKYLPGGFCGHDKDGSPIRVELYGHIDMKGIMASVRKSDLEKTKLLQCEYTVRDWEQQSAKLGKRVDGLTVIFDMEGVGTKMLWRPGLQMYLHMVKVLEDNYPEMLKYLLVVNAPRIFPLLYKLARPLISDEMKTKIHVFGGDYKTQLLKYVDPEEFPAFLGGKQTDPDGNPRCITRINQGGDVPEDYYMNVKDLQAHLKCQTIPRGEVFTEDFQVVKPGTILRWEFKTEDYDIGFGVLYKESPTTKPVSVVPIERVNSHVVAQDGSHTCDKPGVYSLCFDNTFSWTRAKNIYYEGELLRIEDEYMRSEINDLVEQGDWKTLEEKFETTHL